MKFATAIVAVLVCSIVNAATPTATIDPNAAPNKIDMSRPPPPPTNVNVLNFPETQAVEGTVAVSNLPAVQTVGGTVNVGNLPLDADGNLVLSRLAPTETIRRVDVVTSDENVTAVYDPIFHKHWMFWDSPWVDTTGYESFAGEAAFSLFVDGHLTTGYLSCLTLVEWPAGSGELRTPTASGGIHSRSLCSSSLPQPFYPNQFPSVPTFGPVPSSRVKFRCTDQGTSDGAIQGVCDGSAVYTVYPTTQYSGTIHSLGLWLRRVQPR